MDWDAHLTFAFDSGLPKHLALAVSGGGDSVALMHMMHGFCQRRDCALTVLSVDHKLRPESTAEMAAVAKTCADLGMPHVALTWENWDGTGNLQDAARRARYALMSDWVRDNGADGLVLGHTADDQAETVLLRLSRKAGVDGLSAMAVVSKAYGTTLYRPLLGLRRQDLRDYLTAKGHTWADDPSNLDPKYDRIKMRQALSVLEPLGITVEGLGDLARYMGEARAALNVQTAQAATQIVTSGAEELQFNPTGFEALPKDIKRRLLIGALGWIGHSDYAPRREAVNRALDAVRAGQKTTLDGCVIRPTAKALMIYREYEAIRELRTAPNTPWDARWLVSGEASQRHIAALGAQGAQSIPQWRDQGLTLEQVAVHPAVWENERLIAAPTLQNGTDYVAKPLQSAEDFISSLYSR